MNNIWSILISPFEYQFMHNAILAAGLVGLICGLASAFIILKGWSLIGDAISHSVLPGLMVALIINSSVFIFLTLFAIISSWSIFQISSNSKIKPTTSLVMVTSFFMGLGYFLYNLSPKTIRISEILYGKIIAVNSQSLWSLGIASLFILIVILIIKNNLRLVFFDPIMAKLVGLRVNFFTSLFFIILAIVVVLSIKSVGALLVTMLLISPGAIAYLWSKRFNQILLYSVLIAVISSVLGTYLSYFKNIPTPSLIAVIQLLLFIFTVLIKIIRQKLITNNIALHQSNVGA